MQLRRRRPAAKRRPRHPTHELWEVLRAPRSSGRGAIRRAAATAPAARPFPSPRAATRPASRNRPWLPQGRPAR
eukprot:12619993-Alexandrium_andersonii.AAC.1